MTEKTKVSIIVPVYNIENCICKCLDSILIQDFFDFEIIAVNDGSTDSSGEILERYAQKDSRVKVINQKNGGLGYARNKGLQNANGEYVWFIDGDDFIVEGCLSELYNYAKGNDADVVLFDHIYWNDGILINKFNYFKYPSNVEMNGFVASELWILKNGSPFAWDKFIKRIIYSENNIYSIENRFFEDLYICFATLIRSKRVFYYDKVCYYYVYNANSMSNKDFIERSVKLCYDYYYAAIIPIEKELYSMGKYDKYFGGLNRMRIFLLFWFLNIKPITEDQQKEYIEIKQYLDKHTDNLSILEIICNKHIKIMRRLGFILYKIGLYNKIIAIKNIIKKLGVY